MLKTVLVTGGAGYIGSHTVLSLLEAGYEVVVIDDLSNSSSESLKRVEQLTRKSITFYQGNIGDPVLLASVFKAHDFCSVIHFAGKKAVGESTEKPLDYYQENVAATIQLLKAMQQFKCYRLVFSSSATVYGEPMSLPITEDFPTAASNPYGRTKLIIEQILGDLAHSQTDWQIVLLRYFNPVGAHPSGLIGEEPKGVPNNLVPYICQVAAGRLKQLSIFGNDYPTPDGTGIRDYIHVMDLADAHVKSTNKIAQMNGCSAINLGTGFGVSVLEMVKAFEKVNRLKLPYEFKARRSGDIAECWADPSQAKEILGWRATKGLDEMLEDAWRWQSNNQNGYD